MYYAYYPNASPLFANTPMFPVNHPFQYSSGFHHGQGANMSPYFNRNQQTDYGPNPFVINMTEAALQNDTFRTALWTGTHLQLTLMSIQPGEDIGLERHPNLDQFLRIEQGQGIVQMGKNKNALNFVRNVYDDYSIFIPAGTWHNLTNTGRTPLKLYSIYAPPNHPYGTVHRTKREALAAEEGYRQGR